MFYVAKSDNHGNYLGLLEYFVKLDSVFEFNLKEIVTLLTLLKKLKLT